MTIYVSRKNRIHLSRWESDEKCLQYLNNKWHAAKNMNHLNHCKKINHMRDVRIPDEHCSRRWYYQMHRSHRSLYWYKNSAKLFVYIYRKRYYTSICSLYRMYPTRKWQQNSEYIWRKVCKKYSSHSTAVVPIITCKHQTSPLFVTRERYPSMMGKRTYTRLSRRSVWFFRGRKYTSIPLWETRHGQWIARITYE